MLKRICLLVLVVAGCEKSPGPSCEQISDHMLDVTKQAMPGHDPAYLGDRKAMVAQCEKRNPTREMRNCLMKAKTLAELGECQAKPGDKKPDPQPSRPLPTTAPEAPAPAQPVAPAAVPSGSGG
ncbi:MAG TPA: hypothetical protein VMZ53_05025 [Kofleriaceae bacterium]|nr:hypothetical protein [Kofleriaceae bacterium]